MKSNRKDVSTDQENLETEFPALDLGYSLSLTSLEMAHKRLEAIESKNQQLMSFSLAAFVIIVTVANANRISLNSYFLYGAVGFVVVGAILSILAAKRGTINIISPRMIRENHLDLSPAAFKNEIIGCIADLHDQVLDLIEQKWRLNAASLITYLLAAAAAAAWVAVGRAA